MTSSPNLLQSLKIQGEDYKYAKFQIVARFSDRVMGKKICSSPLLPKIGLNTATKALLQHHCFGKPRHYFSVDLRSYHVTKALGGDLPYCILAQCQ